MDYILGDCCGGIDPTTGKPYFSYIIGYGNTFPRSPHHRGSSCNGLNNCTCNDTPNPHILLGAMVGGPNIQDEYHDDCEDYVKSEVATDYNAGITSALAAMVHLQDGPTKRATTAATSTTTTTTTTTTATTTTVPSAKASNIRSRNLRPNSQAA